MISNIVNRGNHTMALDFDACRFFYSFLSLSVSLSRSLFLAYSSSSSVISVYVDFPSALFPHIQAHQYGANCRHAEHVSYIYIKYGIFIFIFLDVCVRKRVLFVCLHLYTVPLPLAYHR